MYTKLPNVSLRVLFFVGYIFVTREYVVVSAIIGGYVFVTGNLVVVSALLCIPCGYFLILAWCGSGWRD
jgi:hypothetical protein